MTTAATAATTPRFNHVAMSVPAELLAASGRAELLDFYGDVFGWQELPTMTEEGRRLVLMAYEFGQFVFLTANDAPLSAPKADHFGMSVATMAELDGMLERARARAATDSRVEIVEKSADDYEVLLLTSFYVRYLLPLMVEVQHFDWRAAPAAGGAA